MTFKELSEKREKILETITCWNSLEDEILKFFCLIQNCANTKIDGQNYISQSYILEKVIRLNDKYPIILDAISSRMFCDLKIQLESRKNE